VRRGVDRHLPVTPGAEWRAYAWVHEPQTWTIDAPGVLHWATRPRSDFWRHTGGVVGADDGDAFLTEHVGDFSVTMRLDADFSSLYDQCGLMVRADERNWLKTGIELDGGTWFSVVATREHSDWSKQAIPSGPVEFTTWRTCDTLRVGLAHGAELQLVRELVFDGPVAVGPYSCSPKGSGFQVSVSAINDADGGLILQARVGTAD